MYYGSTAQNINITIITNHEPTGNYAKRTAIMPVSHTLTMRGAIMRKRISSLFRPLVLFAVCGIAHAATPTFEQRCQAEMAKMSIEIHAEQNGYKIYNNVSARILSEKGMHNYSSELLMGLTDLNSVIEIYFDGKVLVDAESGKECLAPQIDVVLRYNQMRVYVAREFSEYSCPYHEMLGHELRHVQIYQEQLPKVGERVRAAMQARFSQSVLTAAQGQVKATLDHELDSYWLPYIRRELNQVEQMQRNFDSKEETFRLSNSCFGQTSSAMGGSFY